MLAACWYMNKGAVIFVEMYQPPQNYRIPVYTKSECSDLNDANDKKNTK